MSLRLYHYELSLISTSHPKMILEDINCEFVSGTTTYIIGKNGSGKSSLLLSLA
ncbi:ATP-binding cassette domain-containing protein [Candidatus Peribacteria bacterium]|nr:ATP-binding cassette domain-containing protein [Candidatus Peribacteria bacterium]